jgi:hypothetical protein
LTNLLSERRAGADQAHEEHKRSDLPNAAIHAGVLARNGKERTVVRMNK